MMPIPIIHMIKVKIGRIITEVIDTNRTTELLKLGKTDATPIPGIIITIIRSTGDNFELLSPSKMTLIIKENIN